MSVFSQFLAPGKRCVRITSSGNWTVPQGVYSIGVLMCGGGGGAYGTSPGGGGQVLCLRDVAVNPGQVLSITIGAGGASGVDGGNTIVQSGQSLYLLANGGLAATGTPGAGGGIAGDLPANYGGTGGGSPSLLYNSSSSPYKGGHSIGAGAQYNFNAGYGGGGAGTPGYMSGGNGVVFLFY